jgi:hypothetical protein
MRSEIFVNTMFGLSDVLDRRIEKFNKDCSSN